MTCDYGDLDFTSHIVFGRLSFYKQRPTTVHEFEMQNLVFRPAAGDEVAIFPSDDNSVFEQNAAGKITPYARARSDKVQRFTFRRTARFFAFAIQGKFELTNILVQTQAAGKR